ncbi:MAG: FG-GAP repeat domain-containing protein [Candidatus Heimdallarchaeota archaeon]
MGKYKHFSKIALGFILLTMCVNISLSKSLNSQTNQKQESINEPFLTINSIAEIESFFENTFWKKENLYGSAISSPTLSDLDGDGDLEIIILTENSIIYIIDHEGNFLNGWGIEGIVGTNEQLTSNLGVSPYPIALDLNDDGEKEIICATYNPGTIQAWFLNTTPVPNWDIELGSKITSSLSAGDIDGDGEKEIVIGTWGNEVHAFELNGSEVDGFPYTGATDQIIGTPALANLDGDSSLEIVFGSYDNAVHAIDGNGVPLPGWPQNTTYHIRASPAVTDLNNDSKNEIIIGSWDRNLYIYHQNGSEFGGWPWEAENAILNSATIGDLNLDGINDFIIQPTNVTLFAFTDARNSKEVFWNNTQSEVIYEDAIICDIDGW